MQKETSSGKAWVSEFSQMMRKKLEECRLLHERQRKKLDSDLESNPLESSFSAQLMDLMQREEQAANQGLLESQEQISKRVDTALRNETFRHFKLQAQHSQRRWSALIDRQANEREKIAQEVHEGYCKLCMLQNRAPPQYVCVAQLAAQHSPSPKSKTNYKKLKNPDGSINMEAFWEEEMNMRLETYRDWSEHERTNLDMAFNLQVQRVDAEWGAYEIQMRADYDQQRSELEGRQQQTSMSQTLPRSGATGGKWKDKEKQSRLIHTAPVFSPEAGGTPMRRGNRKTAQEKNLLKELEQLDSAFEEAKTRIQFQKRSAIRWINRQSSRMQIQIQTMEAYRKMIYESMEREFQEYRYLRAKCKDIAEMTDSIQNRRQLSHRLSQSQDGSVLSSSGRLRSSDGGNGSRPLTANADTARSSSKPSIQGSFLAPIDGHRVSTPKGNKKPEAWNNVR